jgi:hypothetical protein
MRGGLAHAMRRAEHQEVQVKKTLIATIMILIAVTAFAQMRGRSATPTPPLGAEVTFTGTVTQFNAAVGAGSPELVIRTDDGHDMTFVLGPYWYLQQEKFTAKASDRAEVVARACSSCPNGFAAVTVRNVTAGVTLQLRAADGTPLWERGNGNANGSGMTGGHRGRGMGNGMGPQNGTCNGNGPDMTRAATFDATVVSFTGGAGAGLPTLVVSTASGNKILLVAPYRAVMAAGLTFTAGAKFSITAAPVSNDGVEEWVVIKLRDLTTGFELALRDATTGYPLQGMRGRP